MSIAQTARSPQIQRPAVPVKPHKWRLFLICALCLLSIGFNVLLLRTAPAPDTAITFLPVTPFMLFWLSAFLPYGAASILVLTTKPLMGHWRWVELGIILLGALVLRAMLLPIPPDLSHDSWRYLWDARVTLLGYSPYVHGPGDQLFVHLRDFIYDNSRFRSVPTIYPPGAQAVYLLSYLIAPSNLFVLKGIFIAFDLVTCGALALLLRYRGLDPSRVIIYAWCPLPIVEFAIQGHLDAITLMFMALALLSALSNRRGMRVLTGFLIAMATLTKIYPIVLLLVVVRRRDWALLLTCFATILLAYVPYLILGHGQVFGFFSTYASESSPNGGPVEQIIMPIGTSLGLDTKIILVLEYLVDLFVMGTVSVLSLWQRWRQRISMEAATLILIGAIFVVSSHIFPWYTTALLPWVVMLVGPVWTRTEGLSGKGIAIAMAWYFPFISITAYFFNGLPNWIIYYLLAYVVTSLGLIIAALVGWRQTKVTF
ncbi:MAG: DUF2029 domain-containing protein [Chloroflexi bacterium]|nr:DUF2029 domain-containing protein [Chloroflexota bacterium]